MQVSNFFSVGWISKARKRYFLSALDTKFDEIFMGDPKTASALAMLKYSIKNTNIEPKYLTRIFYEAVGATSDEGMSIYR